MPKAVLARRGGECLHGVPLPKLEGMRRREPPGRPGDRLQAAVLRKRGRTLEDISGMVGRHPGTVHRWLHGTGRGGPDGGHGRKSPGRPRLLTPGQEGAAGGIRTGRRPGSGLAAAAGTPGCPPGECAAGSASRAAGGPPRGLRAGPAFRHAGRGPCHTTAPRPGSGRGSSGTTGTPSPDGGEGRAVPAAGATALRDSPASGRGPGRRGGKGTVRTNRPKKATRLIGAPGDGTPGLQFHDNLRGESYAALAEYARRRRGKAGIPGDNAGGLTGKDMGECAAGTNGAAGIMRIPPRTPQPSPIGTEWRETRAAMADIFGGPDRMRDATMRMLHNREMPIVRLSGWLLPP